jgi:hypothetical protein
MDLAFLDRVKTRNPRGGEGMSVMSSRPPRLSHPKGDRGANKNFLFHVTFLKWPTREAWKSEPDGRSFTPATAGRGDTVDRKNGNETLARPDDPFE